MNRIDVFFCVKALTLDEWHRMTSLSVRHFITTNPVNHFGLKRYIPLICPLDIRLFILLLNTSPSLCLQSVDWWRRWPMGGCLALWAEVPPKTWSKHDAASPLNPVINILISSFCLCLLRYLTQCFPRHYTPTQHQSAIMSSSLQHNSSETCSMLLHPFDCKQTVILSD